MDVQEFIDESIIGGPGHDGYMYCADVYCVRCGRKVIEEIANVIAPTISSLEDPAWTDSEAVPQPIFFGESEVEQYCADCGDYLYGGNLDE